MDKLIATLAKVGAPALATLIGGPVGTIAAAAVGALAEALGTEANPERVADAIEARPDAPAIVREVEATRAPELQQDLEAILRDRQGARDQTLSLVREGSPIQWGAPVVSTIVLLGFALLSYLAMKPETAGVQKDVVMILLGAWSSLASGVVAYWVGSSAGSASKDVALKQIAARRGA